MKTSLHHSFCFISLFSIGVVTAQAQSPFGGVPVEAEGMIDSGFPAIIPDNDLAGINFTFSVPALNAISSIELIVDMDHKWVGDLELILRAPNGREHLIFADTGSNQPLGAGSSTDVFGAYNFNDFLWPQDWWAAAGGDGIIPPGFYRTSTAGGSPTGGEQTVMQDSFGSTYPAGVWELNVVDDTVSIIGTINSTTLAFGDGSSLRTLFDSNVTSGGIFLDLTAKSNDLIVTHIANNIDSNDGTCSPLEIFTKTGSYKGFESDSNPWKRIAEGFYAAPEIDQRTIIDVIDFIVPAGQTRGIHVNCAGFGGLGQTVTGVNGATNSYSNDDLVLFSDTANQAGENPAFSPNSLFVPRTFNGQIYYHKDNDSCYAIQTTGNTVANFCL